ncbi:MAG: DUF6339 family protein [Candidatus Taylorbacteria bacterium]|nr:DUF6339 family protein [Candidatus Taylorbacteria bacterium]
MNKKFQKIYFGNAVAVMRNELKSGVALESYFRESYPVKEKTLLKSTIELPEKPLVLKAPKKDIVVADLENAIAVYEYYKNLDEVQASDPRLWTYLSHVEFRKYALARWGLKGTFKDIKDATARTKAINYILEHWFVSGNDRDLRRHAIARLWWAARLTYAPWEFDPYFADLRNKDPYYYTRVLLFTQDIYQQVLERGMGRSNRILISVLDYLARNKKFALSREKIRSLMKELNLAYGTKKIIDLDRPALKFLIEKTAQDIEKAPHNH